MSDSLDVRRITRSFPAQPADLPLLPPDLPSNRTLLLRGVRQQGAFLFRRLWRISVHGEENVPRSGPVILASNHIGVLDGPLLVALTRRLTFALAKSELFQGKVGAGLEAVGQIPIATQSADTRALRRAVKVLREEHALTIFPEGGRDTGEVTRIYGGVAYLAMLTGAPIVPVALLGTREPGQSVSALPRRGASIHIVYGESIVIDRTPYPRRRLAVAARTEEVRRALAAHVARAEAHTGMTLPGVPAPKERPLAA